MDWKKELNNYKSKLARHLDELQDAREFEEQTFAMPVVGQHTGVADSEMKRKQQQSIVQSPNANQGSQSGEALSPGALVGHRLDMKVKNDVSVLGPNHISNRVGTNASQRLDREPLFPRAKATSTIGAHKDKSTDSTLTTLLDKVTETVPRRESASDIINAKIATLSATIDNHNEESQRLRGNIHSSPVHHSQMLDSSFEDAAEDSTFSFF